jgi:cathepsin A (carboxypeptidase C)
VYDITKECEHPPLCYDFNDVAKFANRAEVRAALGVSPKDRQWQECNMMVNLMFLTDFMSTQAGNVTHLLHEGHRVLVYSGMSHACMPACLGGPGLG